MSRNPRSAKILAGVWGVGLLLTALPAGAQTAVTPPGAGTAADPYRISDVAHLVWMGETTGSSAGKSYALQNDLDAANSAAWNDAGTDVSVLEGFPPIGTSPIPFAGEFDGQGHAIYGLTINRAATGDYVGLFGSIGSSGVVRRLGLEGGSVVGPWGVGSLVGHNQGTVTQCYTTVTVTGQDYVGGLVGQSDGTLTQCHASGTVTGTGGVAGGLAGGNSSSRTVAQCYATGEVTGQDYTGGLLGINDYGSTATQCYATGTVSGRDYVGGLVGTNNVGTVEHCHATGAVAGASGVGGLVGENSAGTLTRCYASGAVGGPRMAGGLAGMSHGNSGTVTQCYATGAVTGGSYAGALVGYSQYVPVQQCYAIGAVTGGSYIGGLVGGNDWATIAQCYWDTEGTGQATSAGGEGRTAAQMRQQGTYVDWSFTSPWGIAAEQNDGYPYLRLGPWQVRFLAGANGTVTGALSQSVSAGQDATPVTAVPSYGFAFEQWSDESIENPRTLAAVSADVEITASFRPAGVAASPFGAFLAVVGPAAVATGRGLWDVTGAYATTVAGNPLTLHLVHDSRGRLTGTATYLTANLSGKGSVKRASGALLLKLTLQGADGAETTRVVLALDLALDATARQLRGPAKGSIRTAAGTTPVTDDITLDLPAAMDGTWTLLFDLAPRGRASSGSALLTLASGAESLFMVTGRASGQDVVLSLIGVAGDPAAKAIQIRATVTPLEGGWAGLPALSASGYGQRLGW